MKRLFNRKTIYGNPIAKHLKNFNLLTNQLCLVDIKFDDIVRSLLLLSSLQDNWDGLAMTVSNSQVRDHLHRRFVEGDRKCIGDGLRQH